MDEVETIDLFARPQRNEKGQFVKGNTESIGNSGKPCFYCRDKDNILKKVKLYSEYVKGNLPGAKKMSMPWIEDLCDEDYLDISEDTLTDWTHNSHAKEFHTELIRSIGRLFNRQKRLLKTGAIGSKNSRGFIFLLEANHGMMRAEKKVVTGDPKEPLEIIITEERSLTE